MAFHATQAPFSGEGKKIFVLQIAVKGHQRFPVSQFPFPETTHHLFPGNGTELNLFVVVLRSRVRPETTSAKEEDLFVAEPRRRVEPS